MNLLSKKKISIFQINFTVLFPNPTTKKNNNNKIKKRGEKNESTKVIPPLPP